MGEIVLDALKETLIMVFTSTIFAVILGFIPAILLTVTANDGLKPNKIIYNILDFTTQIYAFNFIKGGKSYRFSLNIVLHKKMLYNFYPLWYL